MRNPMLARYFNLFLLFWATVLSIFLCPFAGSAQNTPTSINLEGTEWHGTVISRVNYSDNSIATIELTLAFGKRGKVAVVVLLSKSQGVSGIVVGGSIVTSVTPPVTKSQNVNGIYTINGKSVHVEFSDTTIDATMSGSEMKCVSTHESTGTEERWTAYRTSSQSASESLPSNSTSAVDAGQPTGVSGLDPSTVQALKGGNPEAGEDADEFMGARANWDFSLNVNWLVGSTGVIREEPHHFQWVVKLYQKGEELYGILESGRGERGEKACADEVVFIEDGRLKNGKVNFVVRYVGIGGCCKGKMKFTGRLSDDDKTMIGSLEPMGLPEGDSCSLVYAQLTATKR